MMEHDLLHGGRHYEGCANQRKGRPLTQRMDAAGRRRSWRWPVAPHAGSTYVPNVPLLLPTAAFGALHPTLAASGTTIHCTSGMSGWHERHTDLFTTRLEI